MKSWYNSDIGIKWKMWENDKNKLFCNLLFQFQIPGQNQPKWFLCCHHFGSNEHFILYKWITGYSCWYHFWWLWKEIIIERIFMAICSTTFNKNLVTIFCKIQIICLPLFPVLCSMKRADGKPSTLLNLDCTSSVLLIS